jgi:hypothetical protein
LSENLPVATPSPNGAVSTSGARASRVDFAKPIAVAGVGLLGAALSAFGVSQDWDWAGLALNLGAGFVGSFATYVLFDFYVGQREQRERIVDQLVVALHGGEAGLKNFLLGRFPTKVPIVGRTFYNADLKGTEWTNLTIEDCDFAFCYLDGAIIEDCTFRRCTFTNVSFRRSTAAKSVAEQCQFTDCAWDESLWPPQMFTPRLQK